jgi:anti-anti-sigma factor
MDASSSQNDAIFLGKDERGYFVSARGSIRAGLCYPLRDALLARLEGAENVPAVWVDLSQCTYMDSTFIGLLVATDRKLLKGSGGRLHVLNATPECMELLRQLGLETLLLFEERPFDAPPDMKEVSSTKERPAVEFILDAHKALMDTSGEARKKFQLLKETLEKKLKSGGKPPQDNP